MAQKIHGEMSHREIIQAENSYGIRSDYKTIIGKADIKKFDGSKLMAKDRALKNLETLII